MEISLPHGVRSGGDRGRDQQAAGLGQLITACTACSLHKTRKQIVFGEGSLAAKLVIVGEAPGAREDQEGLPLWSPSGRLLRQYIHKAGFLPGEVFVTYSVRCRPPNNREPSGAEMNKCSEHLSRTIELVSPAALLATGANAARALSGESMALGEFRTKSGDLFYRAVEEVEIPIHFTYHPAYILRNTSAGPLLLRDLIRVRRFLGEREGPSEPAKPAEHGETHGAESGKDH